VYRSTSELPSALLADDRLTIFPLSPFFAIYVPSVKARIRYTPLVPVVTAFLKVLERVKAVELHVRGGGWWRNHGYVERLT
jgi:hypothetical protein